MFPRRRFLQLGAGAAAVPAMLRLARAQNYPSRPVRLIVGITPGGAPDIVARLTAQWLSERFGQPFVVENRPGAGTNVATEIVVRAPPDGYTLLLVSSANAVNATLFDRLGFNFIRDIAPVASIMLSPHVIEVNPSFPAKTLPEFIAYAKANPGKISMASGGNGSPGHLAGELLKMKTGIGVIHVPYRGAAQALTDLIGGQVQIAILATGASIEYIRSGKLRPLAVTTAARLTILPEVSTVGEFIPGYEASAWLGLGAPRDTPTGIIETLNSEINAGLADPKLNARLADLGGTALALSPAGFGKLIADDTEKWGRVVKFAGMKPQ